MAMVDWAPPQYLKLLRPLMPHDSEFRMVEYSLKLALRSVTMKVLSVHALHTPEQNIQFEKDNVGGVVLDSWVYSAALPEDNSVAQIAAHNGRFRIGDPSKGALFSCGGVRLHADEFGDEYTQRNRPAGSMQLEFLHLRLSTGQSFVMERDQIGKHPVPDGYNSIKVHNDADPSDTNNFYHEYIINDEQRIWPDFVVNCVYDPEEDRRGLAGIQTKVANWRIQCYQDAFGRMMEDLEQQKRAVEERRRTITSQLTAIDDKITQVTNNHAHAQDKIYAVIQQVAQALHTRTQAKLNLLQSDDVELRRQLQSFEWMDSFLAYQKHLLEKGLLDPVEFLENARQHRLVVDEAPCEIVDSYNQVSADMKVVGNLTVLVDEHHQPPAAPQLPPPAPHAAALFAPPQPPRGHSFGSITPGVARTPGPPPGGYASQRQ
eukprot:TRINITY_DN3487_c0_g1_i1.p1 TRINITY_DN3487_c0_g1~~TRINITY_DN3487_c0_g1_i1.p1  ORF type:complete len:431 (+),score=147.25 TRINITY_DN3487_c0_g1_i1:77-1369(+)